MSRSNNLPTSWRTSVLDTSSALVAVIVGDILATIVLSPYYALGLFSAIAIGLLPATILTARKKKGLLEHYKRAISRFSVWLSVILVANIFTSSWAVFKVAMSTNQMWAGPLAIGLSFFLLLLANRIMNILLPSLGQTLPLIRGNATLQAAKTR